jgi:hypothetical protein
MSVARIEPPGPAFGRPDDKLSEIRDSRAKTQRRPRVSLPLNPGYSAAFAERGAQSIP